MRQWIATKNPKRVAVVSVSSNYQLFHDVWQPVTLWEFMPKGYLNDNDDGFTSYNVIKVEDCQVMQIDTKFEEKLKMDDNHL